MRLIDFIDPALCDINALGEFVRRAASDFSFFGEPKQERRIVQTETVVALVDLDSYDLAQSPAISERDLKQFVVEQVERARSPYPLWFKREFGFKFELCGQPAVYVGSGFCVNHDQADAEELVVTCDRHQVWKFVPLSSIDFAEAVGIHVGANE